MVTLSQKNVKNSFPRDLWLSSLTKGLLMIRSHMSNNKVTYPSDHAVTWSHVTNELHYICFTKSVATKHDRLMASEINIFDDSLTNIWLVFRFLSKFWLSWKNFLFLKHFYLSINFVNFLKNICVDQVVLKIRVLNLEKKILISTTVKLRIRNLNHNLQNMSNWK